MCVYACYVVRAGFFMHFILADFVCVYYYTCWCCESCFVVCRFLSFFLSLCFLFLLSLNQVM